MPETLTQNLISAERVRQAIEMRFNPLPGVTPQSLANDLAAFRMGDMRIATLWEDIRQQDEVVSAVVSKRDKSVGRMEWKVVIDEDLAEGQDAEAQRHQEALQHFYSTLSATDVLRQDERGGVGLLARQMLDAVGKEFAVHEWIWKVTPGREVRGEFRFCPLWWFENRTGRLRYLLNDFQLYGVEMLPAQWLVTASPGLMRATCVAWMYKRLPLTDWLSFCEKFGMPGLLGKTDAQVGSREWDAMVEALKAFGQDWAAVVNKSAEIDTVEVKGGTTLAYPGLIEMMSRSIAALWRGADLSTISKGDGLGASLQEEECQLLEEDDARLITETLNLKVDKAVLQYLFGPKTQPLAYFKLIPPKRQNFSQELQIDEFFQKQGIAQPAVELYSRYNRRAPKAGEEPVAAAAPEPTPDPLAAQMQARLEAANASEQDRFRATARDDLARAVAADLQPVRTRLASILRIEDDDIMRAKLRSFAADLPRLLRDLNADPESARALERALAAALFNGALRNAENLKS